MSDMDNEDISHQEWLGAKWSTWGCLALMGSIGIAWLAIVTALYGIFTITSAFGPTGFLSPDPDLIPPFRPPAEYEKFVGVPPIGVAEFTTGQPLLLDGGTTFTVTRTALDWAPPPPNTPEIEYTMAEIRMGNNGGGAIEISPDQFRMVTEWEWEGPYEPIRDTSLPGVVDEKTIMPGETVEGLLIFRRPDIREVRRYLIYSPPFRDDPIRILLVPSNR
jgi:hypothetical protein